jgi:abortive infection bacteriophage resistance protein
MRTSGGHFLFRECGMMKPATTYTEQMEILKTRDIVIDDEAFCLDILSQLNYYRLTAYMLPFKADGDRYFYCGQRLPIFTGMLTAR